MSLGDIADANNLCPPHGALTSRYGSSLWMTSKLSGEDQLSSPYFMNFITEFTNNACRILTLNRTTHWDGVRNPEASKNMRERMKLNDSVITSALQPRRVPVLYLIIAIKSCRSCFITRIARFLVGLQALNEGFMW